MAVGQFAVCLPEARAGPQARLYTQILIQEGPVRRAASHNFFSRPRGSSRVEGEVLAVSRGFPLPRAVSELRSRG